MENPPMTTLDWPKLWAREPGLTPEGLYVVTDVDTKATMIADASAIVDDIPPPPSRTADLCGFAAVRWLAEHDTVPMFIAAHVDHEWIWELRLHNGEPRQLKFCGTLDEVLRAAVDAVLTAEGK